MSEEKIIEVLTKLIAEGESFNIMLNIRSFANNNIYFDLIYDDKYIDWKAKTLRFLQSNFSNNFLVDKYETLYNKSEILEKKVHTEMLAILNAFAMSPAQTINTTVDNEIKNFPTTIYNTQNQTQHIELNMILEAMKNEIGEDAFNEIKNIVDSEKDINKRKSKIFEKVKSFEIDTLSNLLANIITNPNIWS